MPIKEDIIGSIFPKNKNLDVQKYLDSFSIIDLSLGDPSWSGSRIYSERVIADAS